MGPGSSTWSNRFPPPFLDTNAGVTLNTPWYENHNEEHPRSILKYSSFRNILPGRWFNRYYVSKIYHDIKSTSSPTLKSNCTSPNRFTIFRPTNRSINSWISQTTSCSCSRFFQCGSCSCLVPGLGGRTYEKQLLACKPPMNCLVNGPICTNFSKQRYVIEIVHDFSS